MHCQIQQELFDYNVTLSSVISELICKALYSLISGLEGIALIFNIRLSDNVQSAVLSSTNLQKSIWPIFRYNEIKFVIMR